MTQIVELKQNRDFIEPNFLGYKLSLDEIFRFKLHLSTGVHIVHPSNEQYTYKHAKLFASHNHILAFENESLEGSEVVYYIGGDRLIYKVRLDVLGLEEMCVNWKIPQVNPQQDYNFTMVLPNENFAVVADGCGSLYLIDRSQEWKCIFNDTLTFSFILLDCKLISGVLHVLLFNITLRKNNEENLANDKKHCSILHWVQYESDGNEWKQKTLKQLNSKSELYSALFAEKADGLYLISTDGGFIDDDEDDAKKLNESPDKEEENNQKNIEATPTTTSTLSDQVEECDFLSSNGSLFECISGDFKVTHRALLGREIMFVLNNEEGTSFAIQHNEDVCLYRPQAGNNNEDTLDFTLEHVGSLLALGYIQASKQRRKFTTCSPDLSFSVVAESTRHIFIYRQQVDVTSGELRHRSTGRRVRQLAQQQVVEMDNEDVVLGICVTNKTMFVLTDNKMYAFKMK